MKKFHSKLRRILRSNRMIYAIVLCILIAETTAMSFLKEYSMTGHIVPLCLGLGCYMLVSFLLMESLRRAAVTRRPRAGVSVSSISRRAEIPPVDSVDSRAHLAPIRANQCDSCGH